METQQVFEKLTDACRRVLKSQGSPASIETRTMTLDQFAEYAMDEINKADGEKSSPRAALARIQHLHSTIAVAKSAFTSAELESFDIPVFKAGASISMSDVETRFEGLEKQVSALVGSLGKGKADEEDEKAKAKGKADDEDETEKAKAKAKGKADDEDETEKAKAEEEEDDKKNPFKGKAGDEDEDEKAKKAKEEEDEKAKAKGKADDKDETEKAAWPQDLAKCGNVKRDADLYDWGRDPE